MNNHTLHKYHGFLLILLAFSLPLSVTLSEAFYALAFLLWLVIIASRKKDSLRYTGLEIPILVLAIVYALAVLFSPSPLESARILKKLALFGLFFLLANSLRSETEKSRLISVWLAATIIASVWTPVHYLRGVHRPGGFFLYMTFSHFVMMALGLCLPLVGLRQYRHTSILATLALATGIPALVLTLTRGAWIGFVAGLILFLIIRRKWLFLGASAAILVLVVSVLAIYFPKTQPGKAVTSLLHPFDRHVPRVSSNLARWYMWKASWRMFREHPLFGIGPERFRQELPNHLSEEVKAEIFGHASANHAHNIYFDSLATMGIIGFSGLLFFFSAVFYLLVSRYRRCVPGLDKNLALGVLVAFTDFCIGGFSIQSFHDSEIVLNLCFLLALVL